MARGKKKKKEEREPRKFPPALHELAEDDVRIIGAAEVLSKVRERQKIDVEQVASELSD